MTRFDGYYTGKFSCVLQLLNPSEENPNYIVNDALVKMNFKKIGQNEYSIVGDFDMSSVISDPNAKTLKVEGNAIYDNKSKMIIITLYGVFEFQPPKSPAFVRIYINTTDIKKSCHVKSFRSGMKFDGGRLSQVGCGFLSLKRK